MITFVNLSDPFLQKSKDASVSNRFLTLDQIQRIAFGLSSLSAQSSVQKFFNDFQFSSSVPPFERRSSYSVPTSEV
ncbi:unnamed protein product [Cuscuta campestris]|uniref:Uncharacterized protein n=1 Tax=Cuscuta campestris TaxID=132261 RepID=A0A484KAU5_9ASTE|nr:unnamed protein product [Cuscuta campestris]